MQLHVSRFFKLCKYLNEARVILSVVLTCETINIFASQKPHTPIYIFLSTHFYWYRTSLQWRTIESTWWMAQLFCYLTMMSQILPTMLTYSRIYMAIHTGLLVQARFNRFCGCNIIETSLPNANMEPWKIYAHTWMTLHVVDTSIQKCLQVSKDYIRKPLFIDSIYIHNMYM